MPPSSSTPAISRSLRACTCSRVSAIPISCISSIPAMPGVDRGHRRRARLEAPRRRRGRVVVDVHREDVLVGEPAGRRRPGPLPELAAAVEERESGRAEQVLEDAGGEEVDVELLHVDRHRADRLVGVEQHERAAARGRCARPSAGRRPSRPSGSETCVVETSSVSSSIAGSSSSGCDVGHARAARLLRVPDLADRRELEVGEDDLRAGREPEPARERGDAGRERRRDGDLVRLGVDQAGERGRARPPCARPSSPTARPSRPSRGGSPRTSGAPRPRARPASSC